jgi:hypothetical protein
MGEVTREWWKRYGLDTGLTNSEEESLPTFISLVAGVSLFDVVGQGSDKVEKYDSEASVSSDCNVWCLCGPVVAEAGRKPCCG